MKYLGLTLAVAMCLTLVAFATPPASITICHSTSSETNPFVTIHVSENATAGHFNENGTTKAGHTGDLLFEGTVDCPGDEFEDVCPNIRGFQEEVPEGKILVEGECVDPPIDVCPNIEGDQATVPEGKELVYGQCVDEETPPEDLCDNIEGVQETVPEGMEEEDGVCETPDEEENDNGGSSGGSSSSGSHRTSGSRRGSIAGGTSDSVCALPVPITGFDVLSAVPNDGQNELVWNVLNPYTVQAGDSFNPWTGEAINVLPGTVIYGTNVTSVNIQWWQDQTIPLYSTISANDGFEAIAGLPNRTHHWFQLQPVNDCGAGEWTVPIDPLP